MTVMTLGRFRAAPLKGHLNRAKSVCGYLKEYSHGAIRFRTGIPKHELIYGEQASTYDWSYSVYGNPTEEIPENAPPPKGKPVRTTTFTDANLLHDLTTGRSADKTCNLVPNYIYESRLMENFGVLFCARAVSCPARNQVDVVPGQTVVCLSVQS